MRLNSNPQTALEVGVVRGKLLLARRDFGGARRTLEQTIVRFPQALWPRVFLSHALLQEGKDWIAAEKALRDILAHDPNHQEARQNLNVLLQQQGRNGNSPTSGS